MEIKLYKCSVCKSQKDIKIEDFEKLVKDAAAEANKEIKIISCTDREEANDQGIWQLPAVVVEGEIVVAGYFPTKKELTKIFKSFK